MSINMSTLDASASNKRSSEISFVQLSAHFGSPISEAARELGVCTTLLKKLCRRAGLQRWPYRKLRSIENRISELQGEGASIGSNEELANLTAQRLSILRAPTGTSFASGVAGSRKAGKLSGKGSAAALLKKKQAKAGLLARSHLDSDSDSESLDDDDEATLDDSSDDKPAAKRVASNANANANANVNVNVNASANANAMPPMMGMVDPAAMAAFVQQLHCGPNGSISHHMNAPYYAAMRAAMAAAATAAAHSSNNNNNNNNNNTLHAPSSSGAPMMPAAAYAGMVPMYSVPALVPAPAAALAPAPAPAPASTSMMLPPPLPVAGFGGVMPDDDVSDSTSFSDDLAGSSDEDSYPPHLLFNRPNPLACGLSTADEQEWADYSDCLFPLSDLSALHSL